ncbi:MAG: hypothetical protein AAF789_08410 [Bacteroidota bacterium]
MKSSLSNKTILVGDAGGSKTSWAILSQGCEDEIYLETKGFNAYIHDVGQFASEISKILTGAEQQIDQIYLYAAGLDTTTKTEEISKALSNRLTVPLKSFGDLLGTARALLQKELGYLAILGTGANAGFYDGKKVRSLTSSLGYILGDEGSGAYMGKQLLKSIYRDRLSPTITKAFHTKYRLSVEEVLYQLNENDSPNRYMASFAPFLLSYLREPEMYAIVQTSFQRFLDTFFTDVEKGQIISFSGSIAFYFSDILREIVERNGYLPGKIIASPIQRLALYHRRNG